jgi:hypothetical protein
MTCSFRWMGATDYADTWSMHHLAVERNTNFFLVKA